MFLSDLDLREAIEAGDLIVNPLGAIGPTSIDLHLDAVDQARVWDLRRLRADNADRGDPELELRVARMKYGAIARKYLVRPPHQSGAHGSDPVVRREDCVVVRPGGFVLWQTREIVGTPSDNPRFICFINGKSTRARTGLVVHLTAPTIHAGWHGNITLEMMNCGPLHLVLHEGDAVAQITVAQVSRPPGLDVEHHESTTHGQSDVTGSNPA